MCMTRYKFPNKFRASDCLNTQKRHHFSFKLIYHTALEPNVYNGLLLFAFSHSIEIDDDDDDSSSNSGSGDYIVVLLSATHLSLMYVLIHDRL